MIDECHVGNKWSQTRAPYVHRCECRGGSKLGSGFAFELMSVKGTQN